MKKHTGIALKKLKIIVFQRNNMGEHFFTEHKTRKEIFIVSTYDYLNYSYLLRCSKIDRPLNHLLFIKCEGC